MKDTKIYGFLRNLNHYRIKFIYDVINEFDHLVSRIKGRKSIKTHYARVNNFGDLFNKDLVEFFGYNLYYTGSYKKSKVSLTGSILGAYPRNYEGFVLGSGFILERYRRENNNWKVEMIRGPLSAKQCEAPPVHYADPGIIAREVYKESLAGINKKYRLGIVPHAADYPIVNQMEWPEDVMIINPQRPPRDVARDIYSCENIASSSLHGLIFSDSFGIPNIHIKFGDRLIGGLYKFDDYYMGMDTTGEFLEFDNHINSEMISDRCKLRNSTEYLNEKISKTIEIMREVLSEASD